MTDRTEVAMLGGEPLTNHTGRAVDCPECACPVSAVGMLLYSITTGLPHDCATDTPPEWAQRITAENSAALSAACEQEG